MLKYNAGSAFPLTGELIRGRYARLCVIAHAAARRAQDISDATATGGLIYDNTISAG